MTMGQAHTPATQIAATDLTQALLINKQQSPPNQWEGPRRQLLKWEQLGADKALLQAIQHGVKAPLNQIPTAQQCRRLTALEEESMTTTIGEYLESMAIRPLTGEEEQRTKSWTNVFPRPKKDSDKIRLITDMRNLNKCNDIPKHRADTWQTVLDTLGQNQNKWGITLDLKGWFHHLKMHNKTQRWMRFKHKGQGYQILSMPFGWALSPYWANKLTKPIRGWMNNQGMTHTWWVDDILLLGPTKEATEAQAATLIQKMTDLGITVNQEKSMSQAATQFKYVGHHINLSTNKLTPLQEKAHQSIQAAKHQLKSQKTTPRYLASLAGNLIDATKSNAGLQGLPQQLMKAAAQAVQVNYKAQGHWDKRKCWNTSTWKDKIPNLQVILKECLAGLQQPIHRTFRSQDNQVWTLQTDASDRGWGASLTLKGQERGTCAQVWGPHHQALHITHREALASALAVENMIHLIPAGTKVTLQTDATSTAWGWKKGSKNRAMNNIIAPAVKALHMKNIHPTAEHIPGQTNRRADWLSRNPDPKNYQLDTKIYNQMCRKYKFHPEVDLFATKWNKQCKQYCSWRLDRKSLGNAFQLQWTQHKYWLNPPWEMINKVLDKAIKEHTRALVCLPMWQTAHWWPKLQRIMATTPTIIKHKAIYNDPEGKRMPPPHWATLFTIIQA